MNTYTETNLDSDQIKEAIVPILLQQLPVKPTAIVLGSDSPGNKIKLLVLFPWWTGDASGSPIARLESAVEKCLGDLPFASQIWIISDSYLSAEAEYKISEDSPYHEFFDHGIELYRWRWWHLFGLHRLFGI